MGNKSNIKIQYSTDLLDFFTDRTARSNAKFFIDRLRSGMNLLDCGCGPGSITIDLAEIVAPGKVTGIDIEPAQIEIAKSMQSKRNVMNVRFEVGDINKLPFSGESFDAVFVHGVVEYLKDPVHVFKEIYRVLTKDGILGARHADYGGF
ncbi:MAG: class I SAM-dependent methyltransferase, partial [Spirochaetota bacterium]